MYNQNGNENDPTFDAREKLKGTIQTLLGAPGVEVELFDEQYEMAIDNAIANYRAWGGASKEEAFLHFRLNESESVYTLPNEVEVVRKIYRRGNGVVSGNGSSVDPFSLSYSNTYLLSSVRTAGAGGLLTYWAYHSFDETVGKLFGRDIMFSFNNFTKKLVLERDIRGEEEVLLHVYQSKPEYMLLGDTLIYPWVRDWALAECMLMLGRSRGKFATLPGPQGTISLDGESLKQEAKTLMQELKDRLRKYEDGSVPLTFIIG